MIRAKTHCSAIGLCLVALGFAAVANAQPVTFYTADFEDLEVNPGIDYTQDPAVVNTTPYPAAQPEVFDHDLDPGPPITGDDDEYGWQCRASGFATGGATIHDLASGGVPAHSGDNCVEIINRAFRTDIEHTLQPNSIYTFSFWYRVPTGENLTFMNKVVCKDQTNGHLFVDTGNGDYTTAAGYDTWYERTVIFSTAGYEYVGDPIDFRFGAWFSGGDGDGAYTDNWSLTYEEIPSGGGFSDVTALSDLDAYVPADPVPPATTSDLSVAWGDYNRDGRPDLFLASFDTTGGGVFENDGDGTFTQIADIGGLASHPGLFVDYNNDGWPDIVTMMAGGHTSRNDGGGGFTWLPGHDPDYTWQSEHGAWGDFDNDRDPDFYRPGWQYDNPGPYYPDGVFDNLGVSFDLVWLESGNEYINLKAGRSATAADFNKDGHIDIYVSNYSLGTNYLWVNDGTGGFTEEAVARGVEADAVPCDDGPEGQPFDGGHTIGSAWGDLDNDGLLDLVVINLNHIPTDPCIDAPQFYKNLGPGAGWTFQDMTGTVNLTHSPSRATPALADYDNDGDLDVFITVLYDDEYVPGETCTLLRNDGGWTFIDVSAAEGLDVSQANDYFPNFRAAWGDYDNDGDMDLFTDGKLFRNQNPFDNHYLKVIVEGDGYQVNRDAIGTQVEIDLTGAGLGTLVRQKENATGWGNQNDPTLHFGLGAVAGPVDLVVTWLDGNGTGTVEVYEDVAVDQTVTITYDYPWEPPYETGTQDDIAVFRAPGQMWYGSHSQPDPFYYPAGTAAPVTTSTQWGMPGALPLVGDVTGDGLDEVVVLQDVDEDGVYEWRAIQTVVAEEDIDFGFGQFGTYQIDMDTTYVGGTAATMEGAFLGDVNGDGVDDVIYVEEGFNWYSVQSLPFIGLGYAEQGPFQWGLPLPTNDQPFVGDFNGDGLTDIGVYRDGSGIYIKFTGADGTLGGGDMAPLGQIGTGTGNEKLYIVELNGDEFDDAVMVLEDGAGLITWYGLINDGNGDLNYFNPGTTIRGFGLDGIDIPVFGDITGDGMDDMGVWRTTTAQWIFAWTTAGGALGMNAAGDEITSFGLPYGDYTDTPLTGQFGMPKYIVDDYDCDGDVNGLDAQAFVVALLDESVPPFGYFLGQYPACTEKYPGGLFGSEAWPTHWDCNPDGVIDENDIPCFVDHLVGN